MAPGASGHIFGLSMSYNHREKQDASKYHGHESDRKKDIEQKRFQRHIRMASRPVYHAIGAPE